MFDLGVLIGKIIAIVSLFILFGFVLKWLWNGCLVPSIDGINEITFWQAIGIDVLTSLLLKKSFKWNK